MVSVEYAEPMGASIFEQQPAQVSSDKSCDTSRSAQALTKVSLADMEGEDVVFTRIRVNIEQATGTVLHTQVTSLKLPLPPTLQSMREALLSSKIADESYDLFFPKWTYTMYIYIKDQDGDEQVHGVETDEQLEELLAREHSAPGTIAIKLEQCKNAKYSRFRIPEARSSASSQYGSSVSSASHDSSSPSNSGRCKSWKRKPMLPSSVRCYDGPTLPSAKPSVSPRTLAKPSIMSPGRSEKVSYVPCPSSDPRNQLCNTADAVGTMIEFQPEAAQCPDVDVYGAAAHYPVPPVMPLQPVYYPVPGYWTFAPVSPTQHQGTTYYYNTGAPWVNYPTSHTHCY